MSGGGGRGGGRGVLGGGRGRGGQRNFKSSNNQNNRQELTFYPHGTGMDIQMAEFTIVKDNPILKIQSEFVNGSDIT